MLYIQINNNNTYITIREAFSIKNKLINLTNYKLTFGDFVIIIKLIK